MPPVMIPTKPMRPKPPTKPRRRGVRLSVVIPTPGRGRPLERTLRSIAHQRAAGDEVLVSHDTVDGADPAVRVLAERYDCRYLEVNPGEHSWGHDQIEAGTLLARGDYIAFQDDDDCFTPDAFQAIRERISELAEPRPLMFKFMTPWRVVLWEETVIAESRVGGHCLVLPNIPERIGRWTERYAGDFDFIRSTIDLWPNGDDDVVWCDNLIAWTRPTPDEEAWLIPGRAVVRV